MDNVNLLEDQPIAWTPTPDVVERSRLTAFMKQVGVSTWEELYAYSIKDVEKFTEEVLKFLDIKFDPPYEKLLDTTDGIEFPNWCTAGGLNITEMCLDRWQTDEMKNQPAVIWEGESGKVETLSYAEMHGYVVQVAAALRKAGFKKGDAIGIHLPMIAETINVLLAINRIGAIAVPVFSGYGVEAIASRLNAVGAKALFTAESFSRRGKPVDALATATDAVSQCSTVEKVYVTSCGETFDVATRTADPRFQTFYSLFDGSPGGAAELTLAEDPLIILYTSGTTGKPKGIAHTHASFPIKAAQDMAFGTDVGKGTRISWYTDIGWMMGPWLIYGALINGATICIYDGAPDYPTPDRMWEFCAKHKVEVLGISPTLIRAIAGSGDTLVPMSAKHENTSRSTTTRKGWYRNKLPHFDENVTQFITFRLADSLPKAKLEQLRRKLETEGLAEESEQFRKTIEEYLDRGAGECTLGEPEFARVVQDTLLKEHGSTCDIDAWVIMPNHAHVLLRVCAGHELGSLMKRVKGVSARTINRLRKTTGKIWQEDYFDRFIRDEKQYGKTLSYIENNPVLAGLCDTPDVFPFSSAYPDNYLPSTLDPINSSVAARGDGDKSVPTPTLAPFERHDLSSLRAFASTGEPWNPAPWWWLFEKVGDSKLPIINYSGGTEIAGGILMGNPLLPIKPCSFPAPCPGMDVDILDEDGEPVESGKVGELVIKQPWIGIARGFWQEKERYLDTYWRRFKDIWVHGDWAMRDKDGHWFILGRSDDTLKVAGKRVGPAEVESILVSHPAVTEAAVIGVPDEAKGTAMIAFVVSSLIPHPSSLETALKALVSKDMGKPLAPSRIHFVSALPKTRNAKVMRRVIRSAYLGEDPGDLSALEDPQVVNEIAALREPPTA